MVDAPPERGPPKSEPTIRVIAMPADANPYGDIFGGWLVGQMDMAAGSLASRHSRGRAVTVALDGMEFLLPVSVGDEVTVYASLAKSGRTSMTIDVEAWRRHRHEERRHKVTQARFTFVAIDNGRKPRAIACIDEEV